MSFQTLCVYIVESLRERKSETEIEDLCENKMYVKKMKLKALLCKARFILYDALATCARKLHPTYSDEFDFHPFFRPWKVARILKYWRYPYKLFYMCAIGCKIISLPLFEIEFVGLTINSKYLEKKKLKPFVHPEPKLQKFLLRAYRSIWVEDPKGYWLKKYSCTHART